MKWKRSLTAALGVSAGLLCMFSGAGAVSAEAGQARIRFADTSMMMMSNMPEHLDFYVDGRRVASNVAYMDISTYATVAAGQHDFQVRAAGSAPSSKPTSDLQQTLGPGSYSTVVAVDQRDGSVQQLLFDDAITTPPAGRAMMRFLHMCFVIPAVNIAIQNGPVLISNISFTQGSPYISITAGTYDLELRQADKPDTIVYTVKGLQIRPGSVVTFIGVGGDMGEPVSLLTALDAASASTTPQGGARTGEGGLVFGRALGLGLLTCSLVAAGCLILLARPSLGR